MMLDPADPSPKTWNDVWRNHPRAYDDGVIRPLMAALESLLPAGKLICEVGCGTGKECVHLESLGARVISVDFSSEALTLIKERYATLNVRMPTLVQGDTRRLPFHDDAVDILFHQGLLEHFLDPVAVLQEQVRVLKPGGHMIVDVPQRLHWYAIMKRREMARGRWPFGWETDFTPYGLRRLLLACGLVPVHVYSWGMPTYTRPMWLIRHLHEIGWTRYGRPLMPRACSGVYDRIWHHWEKSYLGCCTKMCVGIVAQKPIVQMEVQTKRQCGGQGGDLSETRERGRELS